MTLTDNDDLTLQNAPPTLDCCVCGTRDADVWRISQDFILGGDARFRDVRCVRCQMIRLDPRPDKSEMGDYYTPETYARAEDAEGTESELAKRLNEYNRRLAQRAVGAMQEGAAGSRVLDVGCGDGRFLAAMAKLGATVEGLETDPVAAGLARRRTGGVIHEVPLEDATLPAGTFDLVSLLHVLEHVPDPRATLTEAKRLLKPGGTLVLALPNAGSLEAKLFRASWYPLDLPRHYWGFAPHTLTRLVEECGFEAPRVQHFPFLFLPQSLRYSLQTLRGKKKEKGESAALKSGPTEGGSLRTRLFLGILGASESLGQHLPGEVMEMTATVPAERKSR
jgi:SAM-dependent methyltransferase